MRGTLTKPNLIDIIRPLVWVNPRARRLNPRYKSTINKYLYKLEKDYITKNNVIAEVLLLLGPKDLVNKWDSSRGAWSTFVVSSLYYAILGNITKLSDKVDKDAKQESLYGTRNLEFTNSKAINNDTVKSEGNSPEDEMYEKEIVDVVRDYIGAKIFDLRVTGMSQRKIAKELGMTAKSLSNRLNRKKLGLIKHLNKHGFTESDLPDAVVNKLRESV